MQDKHEQAAHTGATEERMRYQKLLRVSEVAIAVEVSCIAILSAGL